MLTGAFKDRAQLQKEAAQRAQQRAEQRLLQLMTSRAFAAGPPRQCEIGPFIVDYVFQQQALIVELEPAPRDATRAQARAAFLREMGYSVLVLSRRELLTRPHRALQQIRAALSSEL